MKLKVFLSRKERHEKFYTWHKWFAWHPVIIDGVIVWFEEIEREKFINTWQYRHVDNDGTIHFSSAIDSFRINNRK